MKHSEFISRLDDATIVAAIDDAETKSSGEVRVYISHKERHDALEFAKMRFHELGMFKTRQRNAVLIYVVPRTQQFAVLGDSGIHEKCGDAFWREIADHMQTEMKAGRFTEAITGAITRIGKVLAVHFPPEGDAGNELPNQIARD